MFILWISNPTPPEQPTCGFHTTKLWSLEVGTYHCTGHVNHLGVFALAWPRPIAWIRLTHERKSQP